jgi:hypothetical protein
MKYDSLNFKWNEADLFYSKDFILLYICNNVYGITLFNDNIYINRYVKFNLKCEINPFHFT